MPENVFAARAPSNIAWVKYMGKRSGAGNLPANGSLSMTLDALCTVAEVELSEVQGAKDVWESELPRVQGASALKDLSIPKLDDRGRERLIHHVARVKDALPSILSLHGVSANLKALSAPWKLRSANTFPAASGIASSASSFAAFTLASARAGAASTLEFDRLWESSRELRRELASLARQGSGSSCRSMEGPFVGWALGQDPTEVEAVESGLPEIAHFVLIVSSAQKSVSSSEAHLRVTQSPLWKGRVERAQARALLLRQAIQRGDLERSSRIAWEECWEMHSLFHTAEPPFTYWEPGSLLALKELEPSSRLPSSAVVTMDAGPNLHLSVPLREVERWDEYLSMLTRSGRLPIERILRDRQGQGACLI